MVLPMIFQLSDIIKKSLIDFFDIYGGREKTEKMKSFWMGKLSKYILKGVIISKSIFPDFHEYAMYCGIA